MSLIISFNEKFMPAYRKNWLRFLTWGIALVVLGLFAISAATFTTLVSVFTLGLLIFIGGLVLLVDAFTFWWGKKHGFLIHFLLALLYICVGWMLVKNPLAASVSLTLILGVFYVVTGIFRMSFAPTFKAPMWGWAWLNGMITLILGILILVSWPSSSLFIIGLFIGIDLIFCGLTYIMSALTAKKLIS